MKRDEGNKKGKIPCFESTEELIKNVLSIISIIVQV